MKNKNIFTFNFFIKNRLLKNNFILCCHFVKQEKKINDLLTLFLQDNNNVVQLKLKNNFLKNIIKDIFIKKNKVNKLNINRGFKVYFFSNDIFIFIKLLKFLKENTLPIIPIVILTKNRQINLTYLTDLYNKNKQYFNFDLQLPENEIKTAIIKNIFINQMRTLINNLMVFSQQSYQNEITKIFTLLLNLKEK
jgi:hypothetical protein